jgi:hypothetical protein
VFPETWTGTAAGVDVKVGSGVAEKVGVGGRVSVGGSSSSSSSSSGVKVAGSSFGLESAVIVWAIRVCLTASLTSASRSDLGLQPPTTSIMVIKTRKVIVRYFIDEDFRDMRELLESPKTPIVLF